MTSWKPLGSESISRHNAPRPEIQALSRRLRESLDDPNSSSRQSLGSGSGSGSVSRPGISPEAMQALTKGMQQHSLLRATSLPDSIDIHTLRGTARRSDLPAAIPGAPSFVPPDTSLASTTASSVHPAERRRLQEKESENKKRIGVRVQREDAATLSASEAEARLISLQSKTRNAQVAAGIPSKDGIFKETCSTDVLFLLDTTYSMQPYIDAAKGQVISIMQDLSTAFFNEADIRMAVVGYRDHGDAPHLQGLDFTPDARKVRSFLDTLVAQGGGDAPEDVLGGLHQSLQASWKHSTRCIIHITDAPAHGRVLHDLGDNQDSYPLPGSEPHRLTHDVVLNQLISRGINYALLRINGSTDRMAYTFLKAYAAHSHECKLDMSNKYHSAAVKLSTDMRTGFQGWAVSNKQAQQNNGPQFHECNLGSSYHHLKHLVVKMVTASATRSATLTVSNAGSTRQLMSLQQLHNSPWINSRTASEANFSLETSPPQWDKSGWLDQVCEYGAFSSNVVAHGTSLLDDMMADDNNIEMTATNLTIHKRSRPFAQGAMRLAFYARSDASRNRLVVKSYKRKGNEIAHLVEDMRCQALCKAFALEFNAMLAEKYSLDFIVVTCLQPQPRIHGNMNMDMDECLSLEPFIEGEYVKYNSNQGWVNTDNPDDPKNMAAQAFSHFTFERSFGRFLVSDLQGVGRVLTDPAVHTVDPARFTLTNTNLGLDGVVLFFVNHECNRVCKRLGLQSNRDMLFNGKFSFRETWPEEMDEANMMVCCSNKLCSKIVRMARADTSTDYPGYRWCKRCWGELQWSTARNVCKGPGPPHEFTLSPFFYESQGKFMPRLCPKHLDGGSTAGTVNSTLNDAPETPLCRYGAGCTSMECPFLHPTPPCDRGSACNKSGCTFRHAVAECRFNSKCTKPECPYRHPGRSSRQASGSPASRNWRHGSSASKGQGPECRYGAGCKNMDCTFGHSVPVCPRLSACNKSSCKFRHPGKVQQCRDGLNCVNIKCPYSHTEGR